MGRTCRVIGAFGAAAVLAVVAAGLGIRSGPEPSGPAADHLPTRVVVGASELGRMCRALDDLDWGFQSDDGPDGYGMRMVTYRKASAPFSLVAKVSCPRPWSSPGMAGLMVWGPADGKGADDLAGALADARAAVVALLPLTDEAIGNAEAGAWGQELPIGPSGRHVDGVATTSDGWRVTVKRYQQFAFDDGDVMLVRFVMKRR